MDIRKRIESVQDLKHKEFQAKLDPWIEPAVGVRMPDLRRIAKEIVAQGELDQYFTNISLEWYEERMICGFVIASIKDVDEAIKRIKMFIPYITNWVLCDSFSVSLIITKKHPEQMLKLIKLYLRSGKEYYVRFGAVMLRDHYITDDYVKKTLKLYESIVSNHYYVNMAVAWGLSVCYVRYPEKTERFLLKDTIDKFTLSKYRQKLRTSRRCSRMRGAISLPDASKTSKKTSN